MRFDKRNSYGIVSFNTNKIYALLTNSTRCHYQHLPTP